jgi:hypothetical protein
MRLTVLSFCLALAAAIFLLVVPVYWGSPDVACLLGSWSVDG